jgi:hypothetical protein
MSKIWEILMIKTLFLMTKKYPRKYLSMNKLVKFCLNKNTSANRKNTNRNSFGMLLVSQWPKKSIRKKITNKEKEMTIIEVIEEEEDTIKKAMEIEIIKIEEIIGIIVIIEIIIETMKKGATMTKKGESIEAKDKTTRTEITVDLNKNK